LEASATIGAVDVSTIRRSDRAWTLERVRALVDWRYAAFAIGLIYLAVLLSRPMPLYDARAYWLADWANPYAVSGEGETNAYLYSPAFLQLIAPLRALPYEWFGAAWVVLTAATLIAITRHWLFVALLIPITMIELEVGNIHFLLAAAVYLGMRYPAAWAFVLLTKVTPGVGLVWFLARREWRSLAIALGATALVVALSSLTGPQHWFAWIDSLVGNARQQWPYPLFPVPLWVRLVAAAGLIAWGARTDRRWTLIVGTTFAIPTLWPANLAMIIGLPLFVDRMRRR
jgi:Glycosyltransferase family 87